MISNKTYSPSRNDLVFCVYFSFYHFRLKHCLIFEIKCIKTMLTWWWVSRHTTRRKIISFFMFVLHFSNLGPKIIPYFTLRFLNKMHRNDPEAMMSNKTYGSSRNDVIFRVPFTFYHFGLEKLSHFRLLCFRNKYAKTIFTWW